ncbi:MAG TPA: hypothetical protein DDY77_00970 [Clostridiales bacterium]|nr:hypothetical protein [Clostridiales bacterium]
MNSKKKSYVFNAVIILIVTALSVVYLVKDGTIKNENLKNVTVFSVAAVVGVYLLSMLVWALADYFAVKGTLKDWNFLKSFNDLIYGKLASSVTPLKSGHFPMRVYCYARYGYSFYESLTALSMCQIVASVASFFNYLVVFIIATAQKLTVSVNGSVIGLNIVVLIGLIFHFLTICFVCALAFIAPLQKVFINLVSKIKFRNKQEKRAEYIESETLKYKIYKEQIIAMSKAFCKYIPAVLVYVIYMFLTSSLIYVAYLAVSGASFTIKDFFSYYLLTIGAAYITNVIPIPGAAGSSEIVFGLLFKEVIAANVLGGVLLVWRIGSYYVPLVLAIIEFYISQAIFSAADRKKLRQKDVHG